MVFLVSGYFYISGVLRVIAGCRFSVFRLIVGCCFSRHLRSVLAVSPDVILTPVVSGKMPDVVLLVVGLAANAFSLCTELRRDFIHSYLPLSPIDSKKVSYLPFSPIELNGVSVGNAEGMSTADCVHLDEALDDLLLTRDSLVVALL